MKYLIMKDVQTHGWARIPSPVRLFSAFFVSLYLTSCSQHHAPSASIERHESNEPVNSTSSDNEARNQVKQQDLNLSPSDSQSDDDARSHANQCPVCEDIKASIEKTKELLKAEQQVLHTGKDKQKLSNLRSEILSLRDANDSLSKRCELLLLGATGEMVNPEFTLALKNLALANRWLESCLSDQVMKKPRLLMAYRAAIRAAIRQSEKLLDGSTAPNKKSVIAVPKTVADSEAHLWR